MTVDVINVGHGACTVVRSHNALALIDIGSPKSLDAFLGDTPQQFDFVFLTHMDDDHVRGLHWLLDSNHDVLQLKVGFDFLDWIKRERRKQTDPEYAKRVEALWQRICSESHRRDNKWLRPVYMGDDYQVGHYGVDVLWPASGTITSDGFTDLVGRTYRDRNDLSIALRFDGGPSHCATIAGDCPADVIATSAQSGETWDCDVLLYPHHGGDAGGPTAPEVISQLTNPDLVIFQNGRKHVNIPQQQTLQYFGKAKDVKVLCTGVAAHCCRKSYNAGDPCADNIRLFEVEQPLTLRVGHGKYVTTLPSAQCLL